MTPEMLEQVLLLAKKETMLNEIIVWLKAKNLWENCKKDLSIKIEEPSKKEILMKMEEDK